MKLVSLGKLSCRRDDWSEVVSWCARTCWFPLSWDLLHHHLSTEGTKFIGQIDHARKACTFAQSDHRRVTLPRYKLKLTV